MKGMYCISQKTMYCILSKYGGRRKYKLSEQYTDKKVQIVFVEKRNKDKWLCMTPRNGRIEVTLTDESGKIIQRDCYGGE